MERDSAPLDGFCDENGRSGYVNDWQFTLFSIVLLSDELDSRAAFEAKNGASRRISILRLPAEATRAIGPPRGGIAGDGIETQLSFRSDAVLLVSWCCQSVPG